RSQGSWIGRAKCVFLDADLPVLDEHPFAAEDERRKPPSWVAGHHEQEGSVFKHRLVTSSAVVAVLASAITVAPAGVSAATGGTTRQISASGLTSFSSGTVETDSGIQQPELGPGLGDSGSTAGFSRRNGVNRSRSIELGSPQVTGVPVTAGQGVSSSGPLQVLTSFNGLNHRTERLDNGGNQVSLEPPDQGLCVGNGNVMDIIDD